MKSKISRRHFVQLSTVLGAAWNGRSWCAEQKAIAGQIVGEPTGEKVGQQIFATGGNAFDAIVAAALTAAIAAPYQTGIGGYGGAATLYHAATQKIISLDFNSTAPTAATPDLFQPGRAGVKAGSNNHGWLAAGVPGVLAGLQLVIDRFGTKRFPELVEPAIRLARDGVQVGNVIAANAAAFATDHGSKKLYFQNDQPLAAGQLFRNPELAEVLATLAKRGSVESFYKGDIAQRIAEGFQKNGGLVTAQDMANYAAQEVTPTALKFDSSTIHTAPITSGGITALQALKILSALDWPKQFDDSTKTRAQTEALRLAWHDRLTLLGDPRFVPNPTERLLSTEYAQACADRIRRAVSDRKPLIHPVNSRDHGGTISLSAADQFGNFIALTLTHGNAFGACVTVDGLGLTLGHGMTRFDTNPQHPNAPGPGKRPLQNMCPTIVTRGGQPVLAVGGRGGRKIPNAMFEMLTQFLVLETGLAASLAAPRLHTEGNLRLELERSWPNETLTALQKFGYETKIGGSATLSAVALEDGVLRKGMR